MSGRPQNTTADIALPKARKNVESGSADVQSTGRRFPVNRSGFSSLIVKDYTQAVSAPSTKRRDAAAIRR